MGAAGSKSSIRTFETSNPVQLAEKKWDYIIVGGGTAGCVLANRLSEDPNVEVLVLEAGKSHNGVLLTQIPLAFPKLFKTAHDWDFQTVPQKNLNNKTVYWPRGKILGGSSSINAVMYHHCSPSDFDEWARLTQSPEWSYASLHPYFKKAEGYDPNSSQRPDVELEHRGLEGPWRTSWTMNNEICVDAMKAAQSVGIKHNKDFNTPAGTLGTGLVPGFVDPKGQRSSSATAYLPPSVTSRPNLTIAVSVLATQILTSKSSNNEKITVTGMQVASSPTSPRYTLQAKKEVILCGGTIANPQLLLLSGIGPREELEKLGVEKVVLVNEHVGRNLNDQPLSVVSFRSAPNTSLSYLDSPLGGTLALTKWLTTGGGIYSAIAPQGAAFVRSDDGTLPMNDPKIETVLKDPTSGPNAPDLELVWMAGPFIDFGLTAPPKGVEIFTLGFTLLRPLSKGTITLASKNPFDKPLINPNYYDDENDLNIMAKGLRLALHVANADPLKGKLVLKIGETKASDGGEKSGWGNIWWPADADPHKVTDEELKTYIRNHTGTIYHPVSTCKMGTSPSNSVVDPKLLMHGTTNLRIVDASVFPAQVSGHPTAPIVALAERAADVIRGLV